MWRYNKIFTTYPIRHTISSIIAVLIAGVAQFLISYSGANWIILSAFMMCQTSRGAPVRQSFIMIAIMSTSLILANLFVGLNNLALNYIFLSMVYLVTGLIVLFRRPLVPRHMIAIILSMIVLTSVILQPNLNNNALSNQLVDLGIGSLIGIVCCAIILPIRVVEDFYDALLQVLELLKIYMKQLSENYKNENTRVTFQKFQIMHKLMLEQSNAYPEWVYDVGFNRFLRSGFRYYLIVIDRIIELLNSIELLNRECRDYDLVINYGILLGDIMDHNQTLLKAIIDFIEQKKITDLSQDFVSDVQSLETALQSIIPESLDVIELTPQFIKSTALVRDIRDLRDLLLKLVGSLPVDQYFMVKNL